MAYDGFVLHEWEKEKFDKMIEENKRKLWEEEKQQLESEWEEKVAEAKKETKLAKEEGIEQGVEENTINTIKAMLNKKISYEDIRDITNKTIDEIKEIEKTNKS